MIFEFAYDGNLRTYLSKNFEDLTWRSKYNLGLDIANGLKYLHALDIIHKDLVLFIFILYYPACLHLAIFVF